MGCVCVLGVGVLKTGNCEPKAKLGFRRGRAPPLFGLSSGKR